MRADFEPVLASEYDGEDEGLGRVIASHSADARCVNLAMEWYHRCTHVHGNACALEEHTLLPTRLIRIPPLENEPLTLHNTKGMRGQYAAISYCWGSGSVLKTSQATLDDRVSGFPTSSLPMVLQDAVRLVRAFGLTWLWVDALCILQGDAADWSRESALMAEVYGNSAFTICADHAQSTDTGILLPRHLPVSHSFGSDVNTALCLQLISGDWDHMCDQAVYQRGWAFQERILAPRVLHFFEDQIAWECNTTLYREGFRGREPRPKGHFAKNLLAPYFHQNRFCAIALETGHGKDMDLQVRLKRWNSVIQEMSVRHFTVSSDTLAAVSGLASAIQVPGLGKYFAGVWEHNPFLSMVWHVRYAQSPSPTTYRAPSWSWARTDGQLIWHEYVYTIDGPAESIDVWKAWKTQRGPRLIRQHMLLKTQDPKGEVLDGSYLVMSGFCRNFYIAPHPGTQYDEWRWTDEQTLEKGIYAHMDVWDDDVAFGSSFDTDLSTQYPEIQPSTVVRYLCVQAAQERKKASDNPKILGLVLEQVEEGDAFRRVGLLLFDFEVADHDAWERRELELV